MDHLTSSISSYSNARATDTNSKSKPWKAHEKLNKFISRPLNFVRREIMKNIKHKKTENSTVQPFRESSIDNNPRESEQNFEAHELSAEGGNTRAAKDILPSSKLGESIDVQTLGASEDDLLPSQSNCRPSTNYSMIHNSIITQSQKGYHSASGSDILKDPKRFIHGLTHLSILNFEIISSSFRSGEVANSHLDEESLQSEQEGPNLLKRNSDGEFPAVCEDEKIQYSSSCKRNSTSSPRNNSADLEPSSVEPTKQDTQNKTEDESKSKEYKFKRSNDSQPYREPIYEDKSTWIASNMLQALWNLLEGDEPHE